MKNGVILLFLMFSFAACQAELPIGTVLSPSDDIGKVVSNAPAGTRFYLNPGIYRLQSVRPKDGQEFIGQDGVVFNGAVILSGWRREGGYWTTARPKQRGRPNGKCRKSTPLCAHREDLFVDGVVYRRVGSLEEVAARTWYDSGSGIQIADDPRNKVTEFSVLSVAFGGSARDVVLQDIVIEKYASGAQRGAVEIPKSKNWRLKNLTVQWNHGLGVRVGPGTLISGGSISNNGQMGIGGGFGPGIVIENVEIAHNNYAGYNERWEAGGTKFVAADNLVVRNACVHHNDGPGLWTDINNINIEYVNNYVFENRGDGIKHEISYQATIHGNVVVRNGFYKRNWLWDSQILVQNSQDVEVYDNVVEVHPDYGNGISIIHQDRGDGRHGPWITKNNSIRNNTIIHRAPRGKSGLVADHEREWFHNDSNNKFDMNKYVVPNKRSSYFVVRNRPASFSELAQFGMERNSVIKVEKRQPLSLDCN